MVSTRRHSPTIAVAFFLLVAVAFFLLVAVAFFLLVAVSVLVAGAAADEGEDKSDCSVAQTAFSECMGYVLGMDDKVSLQCCRGLDDVKDLALSADLHRDLCTCILSEMLTAGKVNSGRAAALTAECGLRNVAFLPTNPDFDCSRIP